MMFKMCANRYCIDNDTNIIDIHKYSEYNISWQYTLAKMNYGKFIWIEMHPWLHWGRINRSSVVVLIAAGAAAAESQARIQNKNSNILPGIYPNNELKNNFRSD